jgi:hypothetical protein
MSNGSPLANNSPHGFTSLKRDVSVGFSPRNQTEMGQTATFTQEDAIMVLPEIAGVTKSLIDHRQISAGELELTDVASSPKKLNGKAMEMYAGVYDEHSKRKKFVKDIELRRQIAQEASVQSQYDEIIASAVDELNKISGLNHDRYQKTIKQNSIIEDAYKQLLHWEGEEDQNSSIDLNQTVYSKFSRVSGKSKNSQRSRGGKKGKRKGKHSHYDT